MYMANHIALEFLRLYKSQPVIWNPSHNKNKNRHAVYEAWMWIQENISITISVPQLKRKKESLMSIFRKLYRKKIEMSEIGKIYKPDWFAYEVMEGFLKDVYKPVITTSEVEETNENVEDGFSDDDFVDDFTAEEVKLEMPSSSNLKSTDTTSTSNPLLLSRKRKRNRIPITNTQNNINRGATDESALFGRLVAKKLRRLDEHSREIAMLEIDYLLYRLKYQRDV